MKVAVTGAAGFIGRAVVDRLQRGALGAIDALRLNDVSAFDRPGAVIVQGTYADAAVRDQLLDGGVDVLFHLASLPGGAAQRDPVLGKSVNLDGSIALLDAAASFGQPIVVYASSIAALGAGSDPVDDDTPLRPIGSYGTHKAMIELYLTDLTARGMLDGRSVRPAGIVARPRDAYAGFATAWMSDLFHAAVEGRDIVLPVRPKAHVWLQSIDAVADNIIHAARMPKTDLPRHRAWTLPATVVQVSAMVEALRRRGHTAMNVEYGDGPMNNPPLDASSAIALGFVTDGDTDALADVVLAQIGRG